MLELMLLFYGDSEKLIFVILYYAGVVGDPIDVAVVVPI